MPLSFSVRAEPLAQADLGDTGLTARPSGPPTRTGCAAAHQRSLRSSRCAVSSGASCSSHDESNSIAPKAAGPRAGCPWRSARTIARSPEFLRPPPPPPPLLFLPSSPPPLLPPVSLKIRPVAAAARPEGAGILNETSLSWPASSERKSR